MSDDTRDITIRTATKLDEVEKKLDAALLTLDTMRTEMNERRGMEKLAGLLRTTIGGGVGSGLTILAYKFAGIPLPK